MSARAASAVGMVLLWLGCALFLAVLSEPVPAWIGTVLCGTIVLQSIVAHIGEQISNETARIKSLNDAMATLQEVAQKRAGAGDQEAALAILEASKAVGALAEERS